MYIDIKQARKADRETGSRFAYFGRHFCIYTAAVYITDVPTYHNIAINS